MAQLFDIKGAYAKLAKNTSFSEDECVELLRELAHFRASAAYLASCHAATLESLPKSASKSSRSRHATICDAAAKLLDGDGSPIRYGSDVEHEKQRCLTAVANHQG